MISSRATLGVLVGLTFLNAALSGRKNRVEPVRPSLLEAGDSLPELRLREGPCQVVVAFRSDCPFCGAAADRERSTGRSSSSPPVTWIAPGDDRGWEAYVSRVHSSSGVVQTDSVYGLLSVRAVPAAVLVNGDGIVKRVWPYQGDEDSRELARRCRD